MATSTVYPATAAQLAFLLSLDTEYRDMQARLYEIGGEQRKADAIRGVDLAELRKGISKREASQLIDRMKDKVAEAKQVMATLEPAQAKATITKVELEDGIYFLDGDVIKVIHAVHGSGKQYAKMLDRTDKTPTGKARFVYVAGLIKKLRPEHKMTKAQAIEFGEIYGMCCNCGATLTNETSIERGMGPVCAGKFA